MRTLLCAAALVVVAGCTTGDHFSDLREGMTKQQVVDALGQPDGYRRYGAAEALTYANRLMSGWGWDRADYQVILVGGRVGEYGPGTIRQNPSPISGSVLTIIPLH